MTVLSVYELNNVGKHYNTAQVIQVEYPFPVPVSDVWT
jgi:hypothetical protein